QQLARQAAITLLILVIRFSTLPAASGRQRRSSAARGRFRCRLPFRSSRKLISRLRRLTPRAFVGGFFICGVLARSGTEQGGALFHAVELAQIIVPLSVMARDA